MRFLRIQVLNISLGVTRKDLNILDIQYLFNFAEKYMSAKF